MRGRIRILLLIVVAAAVAIVLVTRVPERELDTVYFAAPKPMVIAHQGGDGLRPSNTLLAFQHAAELGVDVLEMDVHLTRDRELVVMHDATVDRTTDGTGALAEMTLGEVKALDAAHRWPYQGDERPYRGRGVQVPTLAEVITGFPGLRFNVEIKPDSAEAGHAVCSELGRLEVTDRILVASFHPAVMDAFRDACPRVPTSAYESEVRWFYGLYRIGLASLARSTAAALQVPPRAGNFDLTERGFITAVRDRRLHIDFWTINDPAEMRSLVSRGAGGIITDRPDVLLEVLGRG